MAGLLKVRVVPNASRDEVAGFAGDALRIRVRGPAVEGKANASLARFLGEELGVRASAVRIVRGATARVKFIEIQGIETADALRRLGAGNE
jgi:uncharacterized protein